MSVEPAGFGAGVFCGIAALCFAGEEFGLPAGAVSSGEVGMIWLGQSEGRAGDVVADARPAELEPASESEPVSEPSASEPGPFEAVLCAGLFSVPPELSVSAVYASVGVLAEGFCDGKPSRLDEGTQAYGLHSKR